MNPLALIIPAAAFIFCMAVHVLLWRKCPPKNRGVALVWVLIFLPAAATALFVLSTRLGFFPDVTGLTGWEWAAALLLLWAFAGAYIATYPAFEAISPSLAMALAISRSNGMTREELLSGFADDDLFEPRVNDLVHSGLARRDRDRLYLTARGRLVAKCFVLLRAFLALEEGRG